MLTFIKPPLTSFLWGLVVTHDAQEVLIPLQSITAHATILDFAAEVKIIQHYENDGDTPLEAVYKFPLYESAIVSSFEAKVGDKLIKGIVKERDEAKQEYREAVASGRNAYLLEEQSDEIFTANVVIPAKTKVEISLVYVNPLKIDAGKLRFTLPTRIAPRYTSPSEAPNPLESAPTTYSSNVSYGFQFDLKVQMSSSVQSLECISHPASSTIQDKIATLNINSVYAYLDKDLVVLIKPSSEDFAAPKILVESHPTLKSKALMLSMIPNLEMEEIKAYFVFVVDRSGSMDGQKMDQTKSALKLFLKSLPSDCLFNIVSFGSDYSALFREPMSYSEANLEKAMQTVESMSADMGGTEILSPLKHVFAEKVPSGFSKQIFVLTDGQVSNTDQCVEAAKNNIKTSRVFTIGVGNDVSHALIEGMARASRGDSVLVLEHERMETKLMFLLKRSLQPAFEDMSIEWNLTDAGSEAKPQRKISGVFSFFKKDGNNQKPPESDSSVAKSWSVPSEVPPALAGVAFLAYAVIPEGFDVPKNVTLKAKTSAGDKVELTTDVPSETVSGSLVHLLAARIRIRELEEAGKLNKDEIVNFSIRFGVMSRYTSFVAVDPASKTQLEESVVPKKVLVPQADTYGAAPGGGGGPLLMMGLVPSASSAGVKSKKSSPSPAMSMMSRIVSAPKLRKGGPSAPPPAPSVLGSMKMAMRSMSLSDESEECCDDGTSDFSAPPPPPPAGAVAASSSAAFESFAPPPAPGGRSLLYKEKAEESEREMVADKLVVSTESVLETIVSAQKFNGSFQASNQTLVSAIGGQSVLSKKPDGVPEDVWATALVLAYLEIKLFSQKAEWELMAGKAQKWLDKEAGDKGKAAHVLDEARKAIQA